MPDVDAVNVLVHVAVPAVVPAANVQVVNVPVTPLTDKVTERVGVLTVPPAVSVTVAVQVEPCPITTGVVQVTLVVVVRRLTTTVAAVVVVLAAWVPSLL